VCMFMVFVAFRIVLAVAGVMECRAPLTGPPPAACPRMSGGVLVTHDVCRIDGSGGASTSETDGPLAVIASDIASNS